MKFKKVLVYFFFTFASFNLYAEPNNPIECTNKCKEEFNKKSKTFNKWIKENEGRKDNNQETYMEMKKRGNAKEFQNCTKSCFPGL